MLYDKAEIKKLLEEALKIDSDGPSIYLNLHSGDEVLSLSGHDTQEEAKSQRDLVVSSIMNLFLEVVTVDRSLSAEQAVNATGRVWYYKNQVELDSAPVSGPDRALQEIFELDYEPTPAELDSEYVSRSLTADLATLSKYICEKPEAADDRPLACQWGLNPDGTAAYALFDRGDRGREVSVGRVGLRWVRQFRFAGVRKLSAQA